MAKKETKLLKDEAVWECISIIVHLAFPAVCVLCLADEKTPGMDKLYYYVHKTDDTIATQSAKLNQIASIEMESKLKSFFDNCSPDDRDATSDDSSDDSESEDNGDDDNGVMNE